MQIWKVEAMGDVMYIQAEDQDAADRRLREFCGNELPSSMLKWSKVEELPEGEEFL